MPSSHLHLCLPSSLFPRRLSLKLLYAFVSPSSHLSYVSLPFHSRRSLVTLMTFGGWYKMIYNEAVLHRVKEERNILHTIRRSKANWIGHILRRNCLLNHIIEGKIRGTRRRGRGCKQLLDDLKEVRRYWYSQKIKVGLWDHLAVYVSVCLRVRLHSSWFLVETSNPKGGAVWEQQHETQPTRNDGSTSFKSEEASRPVWRFKPEEAPRLVWRCGVIREGHYRRHRYPCRRRRNGGTPIRLLGTNSPKEGALWHDAWKKERRLLTGNRSANTFSWQ
jgi:hypothetical protein